MSTQRGHNQGHDFSTVPSASIPRSAFNRSHGLKTAFDAGYLIPIYSDEALPGDTINLQAALFARLATPIHPVMDNMYLTTHFWAVPIRLIWDNWEKQCGAQDNPGDSTVFLEPQMVAPVTTGHQLSQLSDYLGIPPGVPDFTHSSLWHRAYNLIWNEFYRAQDIQNSITVDTDDGPDVASDYPIQRRGKRHDYFTSSLPWPQKGTTVPLPLGLKAQVHHDATNGSDIGVYSTVNMDYHKMDASAATLRASATTGVIGQSLYADLSTATGTSINALRESFQIQRMYEMDARGGTRLPEILKSHFGVTSQDGRLQRPEFLGGGQQSITINSVPQTESSDATTAQGTLAAFGTSFGDSHRFVKSFTEHCILIGLVSARADLHYQQGLERQFSRRTRFDRYWPSFAHLGEQAILAKELFITANETNNDVVFGYIPRYDEYRYKQSRITSIFRSDATGTLDAWHLAEDLSAAPTLNPAWIQDNPPVDRVIAVDTEPHFILDGWFTVKHVRPMPTYSIPGTGARF